jgi:hypothetical protein
VVKVTEGKLIMYYISYEQTAYQNRDIKITPNRCSENSLKFKYLGTTQNQIALVMKLRVDYILDVLAIIQFINFGLFLY